jgi:hypothetical protein
VAREKVFYGVEVGGRGLREYLGLCQRGLITQEITIIHSKLLFTDESTFSRVSEPLPERITQEIYIMHRKSLFKYESPFSRVSGPLPRKSQCPDRVYVLNKTTNIGYIVFVPYGT